MKRTERLRWRARRLARNQAIRTRWGRQWVAKRIRREREQWGVGYSEVLHPSPENVITAPCIWVWELYAPSQIPSLEGWMKRLGADPTWKRFRTRDDVLSARGRIGFQNQDEVWLPTFVTNEAATRIFSMRDRVTAELPTGVEMAVPKVSIVPGGLAVLSVALFYDEAARLGLDALVRKPFNSRITPNSQGGYSEKPASRVQEEEIEAFFSSRVREAHEWLAGEAPGALAAHARPSDIKAMRLVTYRDAELDPGRRPGSWYGNLELRHEDRGWQSSTMPLSLYSVRGFGAQLSGIEHEVRTFDVTSYPEPPVPKVNSWLTCVSGIERRMTNVAVMEAIDNLIEVYARELGKLRDLPAYRRDSPSRVFKRLRKLRREIQILTDARATMEAFAADRLREVLWDLRSYDGGQWRAPRPTDPAEGEVAGRDQLTWWLGEVPRAAETILGLERQIRERLKLEADLLSTTASVRAQRRAFRVSLLALAVASAGAYVAIERFANETEKAHETKSQPTLTAPGASAPARRVDDTRRAP